MLRKSLDAGSKIRFLLIDSESHALEMSAARSMNIKDTEYFRRRVESALSDIAYLTRFNNDRKQSRARSAKLDSISVRLLSYAPSFGLLSFDANKKNGIIFVEVYPHKYGYRTPPTFELTPENDEDWYRYFVDQFEEMWQAAKPWGPKANPKKIQPGDQQIDLRIVAQTYNTFSDALVPFGDDVTVRYVGGVVRADAENFR